MQVAILSTEGGDEYLPASELEDVEPKKFKHEYDLKRGGEDEYGRPVKEIYAHTPGEYVVYVTEDDMIHTLAEHEELLNARPDINEERARIRDYKENAESLRSKYQNSYAKAMVAILKGPPDVALVLLKKIRENMEKFLKRESSFNYLVGAAVATAMVLVPYLGFYWYEERFKDFSDLETGVFYAMAFACMGGFLSVATGAGRMRVDLLYNNWTKRVYGMFRIAIAVVSGVLIFYVLRAGLGGDAFKAEEFKSLYGIYVLCAAAGFFEKLVPNAMLRMAGESASDENANKKLVDELRAKIATLEKEAEASKRASANSGSPQQGVPNPNPEKPLLRTATA